jgi:non-heme chloroperoxidase
MRMLAIGAVCLAVLAVCALVAAFTLAASAPPRIEKPEDIFGFGSLASKSAPGDVPALERYPARDGEKLAYRLYESPVDRILIFIHGSTYHGGGYHALAASISAAGLAKVVLPNLRGHYQSGARRGDVD